MKLLSLLMTAVIGIIAMACGSRRTLMAARTWGTVRAVRRTTTSAGLTTRTNRRVVKGFGPNSTPTIFGRTCTGFDANMLGGSDITTASASA